VRNLKVLFTFFIPCLLLPLCARAHQYQPLEDNNFMSASAAIGVLPKETLYQLELLHDLLSESKVEEIQNKNFKPFYYYWRQYKTIEEGRPAHQDLAFHADFSDTTHYTYHWLQKRFAFALQLITADLSKTNERLMFNELSPSDHATLGAIGEYFQSLDWLNRTSYKNTALDDYLILYQANEDLVFKLPGRPKSPYLSSLFGLKIDFTGAFLTGLKIDSAWNNLGHEALTLSQSPPRKSLLNSKTTKVIQSLPKLYKQTYLDIFDILNEKISDTTRDLFIPKAEHYIQSLTHFSSVSTLPHPNIYTLPKSSLIFGEIYQRILLSLNQSIFKPKVKVLREYFLPLVDLSPKFLKKLSYSPTPYKHDEWVTPEQVTTAINLGARDFSAQEITQWLLDPSNDTPAMQWKNEVLTRAQSGLFTTSHFHDWLGAKIKNRAELARLIELFKTHYLHVSEDDFYKIVVGLKSAITCKNALSSNNPGSMDGSPDLTGIY